MPGGSDQTLRPFLWRAGNLYPDREIVSRTHEGVERYTYDEYADRAAALASALDDAGVEEGDRVGTVCWNHHRHFEAYFAIPGVGAQLHTINPLLPEHHLQHIVEDAQDRILLIDPSLLEAIEAAYDPEAFESVEQFVVMGSAVPDTSLEPVVAYEEFVDE
ncbi:MAG TPA: AMP-binding protein, partial [Natronoarchaeum rubrum]|nr:AMP-binding protein [Natronoarchaeum rubrum]